MKFRGKGTRWGRKVEGDAKDKLRFRLSAFSWGGRDKTTSPRKGRKKEAGDEDKGSERGFNF